MNAKIGFVGVGNMGYGMVKNLLAHNFSLLAYDIDQKKLDLAIQLGAEKAKNVKDLANSIEVCILALPHPDISKEIITIVSQSNVKTIIESSTLTPEDSSFFNSELAKKRINYLCAPMLAGKQMALEGRIHFLVEGSIKKFEQYKDIFESMGNATYMGDVPNATLTKLAYNICRYSSVATALTVIEILRQYSNNLTPMYQVLADESLDNFGQVWKEEMKEVAVDDKPYKFAGSKIPVKDLSLVMTMAQKKGLSINFYEEIKSVYESISNKK